MSNKPERQGTVSSLLERTEFLEKGTDIPIATKSGLAGSNLAEGATIKLARKDDVDDSVASQNFNTKSLVPAIGLRLIPMPMSQISYRKYRFNKYANLGIQS